MIVITYISAQKMDSFYCRPVLIQKKWRTNRTLY